MSILLRFLAAAWTEGLSSAPVVVLAQAADHDRPNVLVYVGDDLGRRGTGPYGNRFIRTRNIDRLAQSGLLVRYAFGTTPQFSPFRISSLSRVQDPDGFKVTIMRAKV